MSSQHNALYYYFFKNSAIVGELDEELDGKLDLSEIRAEPIDPVVH